METSASFEARYAPLLYPTNQSYGPQPQIELWLTTFNRAACLASDTESAVTTTEWIYEERISQSLST